MRAMYMCMLLCLVFVYVRILYIYIHTHICLQVRIFRERHMIWRDNVAAAISHTTPTSPVATT